MLPRTLAVGIHQQPLGQAAAGAAGAYLAGVRLPQSEGAEVACQEAAEADAGCRTAAAQLVWVEALVAVDENQLLQLGLPFRRQEPLDDRVVPAGRAQGHPRPVPPRRCRWWVSGVAERRHQALHELVL